MPRHLLNEPILLFSPPDALTPESSSTKMPSPKTADDINDLFKDIDKEEPPVEKKEVKTKKEQDDKEIEEPEDDEKDDDLELVDPDEDDIEKLDLKDDTDVDIEAPPRKKEILKKYPDVFKDFPFLEKMMYRDKQITELFGSFDDAKEIAEKSDVFNNFETQLLAGNTEEVLKSVKEAEGF